MERVIFWLETCSLFLQSLRFHTILFTSYNFTHPHKYGKRKSNASELLRSRKQGKRWRGQEKEKKSWISFLLTKKAKVSFVYKHLLRYFINYKIIHACKIVFSNQIEKHPRRSKSFPINLVPRDNHS